MVDLNEMMKQAQKLQSKMADMQSQLENVLVEGEAGGGLVKVTMTAKMDVKSVFIDPSLFGEEEKDVVEDLIVAAHKAAKQKAEATAEKQMSSMAGGFPMPEGFKMPF